MKNKHTPAPWSADMTNDPDAPIRFTVTGPDGGSIAACASSVKRTPAEKRANALLIAAAPRLLEFVRLVAIGDAGPLGAMVLLDELRVGQ